eukprot:Hpha_TRINITY_DN34421_c0_g1::TRINITY_DN34421_c0_g1_i1::g.96131::m.96131
MPRMALFRRFDASWVRPPGMSVSVDAASLFSDAAFPGMTVGPAMTTELGGCAEWEVKIVNMPGSIYIGVSPEKTRQQAANKILDKYGRGGGGGVQYIQDAVVLSSNGKLLVGSPDGGRVSASHAAAKRPQVIGTCPELGVGDRIGVRFTPASGSLEFFVNSQPALSTSLSLKVTWCPCIQLCAPHDAAELQCTAGFSGLPDPEQWKLTAEERDRLVEALRKGEMLGRMNATEWTDEYHEQLKVEEVSSPAKQRTVISHKKPAVEAEDWESDDD